MDQDKRSGYSDFTYNRFSSDLNGLLNKDIWNKAPLLRHISASSTFEDTSTRKLEYFVNELQEQIHMGQHLGRQQKTCLSQSLMAVDNLIQSLKLQYHDELPLQVYQKINRIAQDFENVIKGTPNVSKKTIDMTYNHHHVNSSLNSNKSSLLSLSEKSPVLPKSTLQAQNKQYEREWDASGSEFEDSF